MFIQKNEGPNGDWKILRVLLHTDARRIQGSVIKNIKMIKNMPEAAIFPYRD
jgi:hypothetical protein